MVAAGGASAPAILRALRMDGRGRFEFALRVLASGALLAQAQPPAVPSSAVAPSPSEQHGHENGPAAGAKPLQVTLTYGNDLNALIGGGRRTGVDYLGRIGLIADADLDRLLGWHGASAHLSIQQISGQGLSQHRIGNLLAVSGLEAEPALRLFNLWVQQAIGRHADIRIGQFTAGQEFAISDTASLFVNSTAGRAASPSTCQAAARPIRWLRPAFVSRSRPTTEPVSDLRCSPATRLGPGRATRSGVTCTG
jgi:carbohydrate-selective porin OprB